MTLQALLILWEWHFDDSLHFCMMRSQAIRCDDVSYVCHSIDIELDLIAVKSHVGCFCSLNHLTKDFIMLLSSDEAAMIMSSEMMCTPCMSPNVSQFFCWNTSLADLIPNGS